MQCMKLNAGRVWPSLIKLITDMTGPAIVVHRYVVTSIT